MRKKVKEITIMGETYKAPYPAFAEEALPVFPLATELGGKCVEVRTKAKSVVERDGKRYDRYELIAYMEFPDA